jgi:hypothetical protein
MGDHGEATDFDHVVADLQRQINQDRYVMSLMNQFAHRLIMCDNQERAKPRGIRRAVTWKACSIIRCERRTLCTLSLS